jgi:hypothetical protein
MKLFRFIRDNSLFVVAAVLLTACGTQAKESADSTSTPPPAEPTASTADPSVESTGQPEKPQSPGGGGVAIAVPSLPVGGNGPQPPRVHQCVHVPWIQGSIPKNFSVLVKVIRFGDDSQFDKGSSGCDRIPGCAGFAFTSTRMICSVPVTAKEPLGRSTSLFVTGELRCPTGQDQACRDFVGQIGGGEIRLSQPEPPSSDKKSPSSGENPPS